MTVEAHETENLFSYGTLRQEEVQIAIFGRRLKGQPDVLVGYRLTSAKSQDRKFNATRGATHHRNLQFTGNEADSVEGCVFAITKERLAQADKYEPFDYRRVRVKLKSGVEAWVYLQPHSAD